MSHPLEVRNPRSGGIDCHIDAADADTVAAIAAEMRRAQPAWEALGIEGRGKLLCTWADALAGNSAAVVDALSVDTGRRLIARTELLALPGMIRRWVSLAPAALDESGERDSAVPGVRIRDQYVPHALVGVISPWNFPLLLSMIDAIPALVAGCAVLVKPSEVTPRFIAPLMQSIATVPELAAVFRFVAGDGQTGAALIGQADAIAFTGSVRTGRLVAEACARNFIPAFLELGGKDPCIVLPSANVDKAARIALRASVQATGQACQSLERIYVHESLYQPFVSALVERAKAVELNYPDIGAGHIGPLIFHRQADIIADHLQDAVARGARVLCGGQIETHGGGCWIRPTVVVDVTHDMKLIREETFGPVMPVMSYQTIDEAVRLANDTEYGLSAAVIGEDLQDCEAVARRLNAGAVGINDGAMTADVHDATHDSFGFSGMGVSRMGPSGLTRYLRRKALMFRNTEARGIDSLDERLAG